jgi:hypothetical protein
VLPAVLFHPFGGAEKADDGVFAFGALVSGALCGLAAGVLTQC